MTQLIRSGLPELPSLSDDKMEASLRPLYVAINQLAKQCSTLFSSSLSIDIASMTRDDLQSLSITNNYANAKDKLLIVTAGETLAFGHLVYAYKDSTTGLLRIKKWAAVSSDAVPGHLFGIVVEPTGMTAGVKGRVMVQDGVLTNLTGVTPGKYYWPSPIAGTFAPTSLTSDTSNLFYRPIAIGLDANNILVRFSGFTTSTAITI